jgi:hypothetical protein
MFKNVAEERAAIAFKAEDLKRERERDNLFF